MKERVYTRDVILVMLAGFCYMCCSMSTAPIVAGYAESVGASSVWMGIISALITATAVVCRPITGNMADRMEKFPMVVAGCMMMIAACVGYTLFPYIWCIAALRVLHGAGYACCSIGMSTWVTLLLPPGKLGSGVGVYGTVNALAMAVAPVVGIRVKSLLGYRWSFLVAGGFALMTILLVFLIHDHGKPVAVTEKKKAMFLPMLVVPRVVPIAIALALISVPYTANKSFLVSYVEKMQPHLQPELFFTIYAVVLVLLRVVLKKQYDRVPYSRFLLICTFAMLGTMAVLYFMDNYLLMFLGASLMAAGYGILFSVSQSAAAATAPPEQRGLAMGTYYLGLDFGSAVGPVVGGMLYGGADLKLFYPSLSVFAILCFGMYFFCRWFYRETEAKARTY